MNMSTLPPEAADEADEIRELLRQSLETVLERNYSFEQRREARAGELRHSAAAWTAYAELGLTALTLPEAHGGLPGSLTDIAMAAELMGGALALEPYRPTMVAARLLAAAGTPSQQAEWLPGIAAGRIKAALAHDEAGAGLGDPPAAAASREAGGWRLSGRKAVVAGGDAADVFIISASADGETALFVAPAAGLSRRGYGCFDWTGAADLELDGLLLPAEARLEGGVDALARALDEAAALAAADAVGAIRAANRLTQDYSRTRKQFGVAIASFQVLQHRMVDMAIAEEMTAPLVAAAISACDEADPVGRARLVSAAKVKAGESARFVGQQCVQLHGGMGLTQEYPAAHYFARLGLFERAYGDTDAHLLRFAALSREAPPAA